jgi:hypothetical protein
MGNNMDEREKIIRETQENYARFRRLLFLISIIGGFLFLLILTCSFWGRNLALGKAFPFSGAGTATLIFSIISLVLVYGGVVFFAFWSGTKRYLWFDDSELPSVYSADSPDVTETKIEYLRQKRICDRMPSFARKVDSEKIHKITKSCSIIISATAIAVFCSAIGTIGSYIRKYDGYDDGWYYIEEKNEATLVKYVGDKIEVTVPRAVNGVPVVAIKDAFKDSAVESVVINSNVKQIYPNSFAGCKNIKSLTLPFIGDGDTSNEFCVLFGKNKAAVPSSLNDITFVDGMTRVEPYTFSELENITSISLPQSVAYIGKGAFAGCVNLETLQIPFVGESIDAVGKYALFGYIFGTGVYVGTESALQYAEPWGIVNSDYYSIPSTLKNVTVLGGEIKSGAFYNCGKIQTITLADGVTAIGSHAFNGCANLEKVTFSSNIVFLGANAFANAPSSRWFGESYAGQIYVGKVLYKYKDDTVANAAFTIRDGTTQIYDFAFYNCAGLERIVIPASVKKIGYNAFFGVDYAIDVNYGGTLSQWNDIEINGGNAILKLN